MKRVVGIFSLTAIVVLMFSFPGDAVAQYPGGGTGTPPPASYTTEALIAGLQNYLSTLSWRAAPLIRWLDGVLFMTARGLTKVALRMLDVFMRFVNLLIRIGVLDPAVYDEINLRIGEIEMTILYGGGGIIT